MIPWRLSVVGEKRAAGKTLVSAFRFGAFLSLGRLIGAVSAYADTRQTDPTARGREYPPGAAGAFSSGCFRPAAIDQSRIASVDRQKPSCRGGIATEYIK